MMTWPRKTMVATYWTELKAAAFASACPAPNLDFLLNFNGPGHLLNTVFTNQHCTCLLDRPSTLNNSEQRNKSGVTLTRRGRTHTPFWWLTGPTRTTALSQVASKVLLFQKQVRKKKPSNAVTQPREIRKQYSALTLFLVSNRSCS